MININFKATSILLTEAIRNYAEKRIVGVERFLGENSDEAIMDIELSQTTKHHKAGPIFRTEINLRIGKMRFRAVSVKEDLYASIDDAKDQLEREVVAEKGKSQRLFRRGALAVKNAIKGIGRIPSKFRRKK